MDIFIHAGIFIYPLALCSLIAVFITFERLIALRSSRVMPASWMAVLSSGRMEGIEGDSASVAGRIVQFYHTRQPDADALKAYARLEVSRMERGVFLLEVVIGAAPLIGLLGTVTGLTQVFSGFSAETGLPDPATFIRGIALALNTTILGLAIAIPALAAHAYVLRRVESLAVRIGVAVQALLQNKASQHGR
ncbi:MotA/TolQ/ExbB proton channel family protein [Coraliomargarita sp. SDUM461004]|uniref:MotA/TolQ/ExbB proton channel family protein n=1 Tax=Thalassobacterium sedimentorum TaxID=3041258 RepID=A0ABU1AE79_9BACT|nr:MotA/TolQ/ExbB proton channel family protein [Coraliomargarita sp. SDUM461004]MDQ8193070.1 MotA/TolQ/ExbB proton channel family protein [Coraliomargarita sp. SDUM461004]